MGVVSAISQLLRRLGTGLRRASRVDDRYERPSHSTVAALSAADRESLRPDHPRLRELQDAYRALDLPVMVRSKWGDGRADRGLVLSAFRGDNAFVWQYRQFVDSARLRFYLAYQDVRRQDGLSLLDRLDEDGAFGCWTFCYSDERVLSRDLLDSVIELNYLEQHFGITRRSDFRILDIGAGYGRLAHRACEAFSGTVSYDCVDAIPQSTYLCEFYLKYRGLDARMARSIPMHRLELLHDTYDLAVNIHSFSEAPRVAIRWWLEFLRDHRVPNLLIIPNNQGRFLSSEQDGKKLDFSGDIAAFGYVLCDSRSVYLDDDLREFIGIEDRMHLFSLKDA